MEISWRSSTAKSDVVISKSLGSLHSVTREVERYSSSSRIVNPSFPVDHIIDCLCLCLGTFGGWILGLDISLECCLKILPNHSRPLVLSEILIQELLHVTARSHWKNLSLEVVQELPALLVSHGAVSMERGILSDVWVERGVRIEPAIGLHILIH